MMSLAMFIKICILLSISRLSLSFVYRPESYRKETASYSMIKHKDTREGPYALDRRFETWMEHVLTLHMRNMTLEIIKDVTSKMIVADLVSEQHQGSLAYDVGFIASSIRDKFKFMVQIYHDYADSNNFLRSRWSVVQYMQANFVLHGFYRELLMDRDLYFQVIAAYAAKKRPRKIVKAAERERPEIPQLTRLRTNYTKMIDDEDYKKGLRYRKWAQKWQNFDPAKEGVNVDLTELV